jgi:hypothetical protein
MTACSVARIAQYEVYVDTTGLQPGAARTEIENKLGPPVREWDARSGVHCASYEFVAGRLGSAADASAALFMDVATAGVWEGADSATHNSLSRNDVPVRRFVERVVVTYGADANALGFFDNYAKIPADGVSGRRLWTHP